MPDLTLTTDPRRIEAAKTISDMLKEVGSSRPLDATNYLIDAYWSLLIPGWFAGDDPYIIARVAEAAPDDTPLMSHGIFLAMKGFVASPAIMAAVAAARRVRR